MSKYERPGSTTASRSSPSFSELMQCVVDRGERYFDARRHRFAVQMLGGDVTIPAFEKKPGQGEALTRRPQSDRTEPLQNRRRGIRLIHVTKITTCAVEINSRIHKSSNFLMEIGAEAPFFAEAVGAPTIDQKKTARCR